VTDARRRSPASRLLDAISLLLPAADRAAWLEEWQAELWVLEGRRSRRSSPSSLSMVLGSIPHALWERKEWAMEVLFQDVRFALRQLRRTPGFTFVVVFTLAIGVTATTTIFSLVNATLLQPPEGIARPEEIVQIGRDRDDQGFDSLGYAHLAGFRTGVDALEAVAAYAARGITIGRGESTELRTGQLVTGDYFRVLGVVPRLGRVLGPEDEREIGGHPVAVVSERYWRDRLGADPSAVGADLFINGSNYTIVGVAPTGFLGTDVVGEPTDAWLPVMMAPTLLGGGYADFEEPGFSWLWMIGRLTPGATPEQAREQLDAVWRANMTTFWGEPPREGTRIGVVVGVGLRPEERQAIRRILSLMMGVVALVLVITCANVAGLVLARGAGRGAELGVRAALGAGTTRLVRQLLTENVLMALAGGLLATLLTYWTSRAFPSLLPWSLGVVPSPDLHVLLFALLLSFVTGLAFGLLPAMRASRRDASLVLRETGALGGRDAPWLRNGLVVLQVALSFVLLGTTALMLRSLSAADRADPGFDTEQVLVVGVNLDIAGYDTARGRDFYRRLRDGAAALPGVESVAIGSGYPFSGWSRRSVILPDPEADPPYREIDFATVSSSWFATMGVPMLRGEGFPRATNAEDPTLVVLSASAARLLFGQEDPVGRELPAPPGETGARVVGVVPDLQVRSLRAPAGPAFYEVADQRYSGRMMLLVRGTNVEGLARPLRELIAALDPDLGIGAISTLHERMLRSLGDTRVVAQLAGLVASVAIFLAAIGLYGIVSFATVSRTAEIGLRMALGARAGSVRALVLRRGMTLTIAGLLIGLGFTLAVGGVLASLLYGISPRDPGALIASTVGLAVIALIAAWVPARRATRVDPVRALRHD
jgi:predicted permease